MVSSDRKKVFYINHSGELLIWLLIILAFVFLSSFGIIFRERNDENDYQLFLQDVDGLIVGSPVRMMGVEVGYVTKIKPIKDEVYVNFIITNKDVSIPQGTAVTVEFTGLAGSKSLELYLADNISSVDKSLPMIIEQPPKRLHDSLSLLNNMFKKLGSIIYTTSKFGSKLQENNILPKNITNKNKSFMEFINYSDKFLDESNTKANEIRNSLEELKHNAK
ncbi:MCE family protein [bacterium]|nr:MCE family protein [bacterium]